MRTFEEIIGEIREQNSRISLSAKQNLDLKSIKPGQLHRIKNAGENTEFFYLVTNCEKEIVDVIPGSLDGLMAGPEDIVLPKTVMGGFIFLSMDLAGTLPKDALGEGFALLDAATYNRIIDSQIKYETGEEGEQASFPFALPYTGKSDSRILYHEKLALCVTDAQEKLSLEEVPDTVSLPEAFFTLFKFKESMALAAASSQDIYEGEFAISGIPQTLYVTFDPEEKQLVIRALEANGELSSGLDNWSIYDEKGKLGEILDGVLDLHYTPGNQLLLALQDPDGKTHKLEPVT